MKETGDLGWKSSLKRSQLKGRVEVRDQLCTWEECSRQKEQQRKDRGKSVPEHLRNSKEVRGAEAEGARGRTKTER